FNATFILECSSTLTPLSSSMDYTFESDFLSKTEFSCNAEVDALKEAKNVIVLGTIKVVYPNYIYMAYNYCPKFVESYSEGGVKIYSCNNEDCIKNKRVINPFPKFNINFKVQDTTGTMDLIMFDGEAKRILKNNATDIDVPPVEKINGVDVPQLSKELKELIDRKFAFKIQITSFNINNQYKYYIVMKVTNDVEIIVSLDRKHNADEVFSIEANSSQSEGRFPIFLNETWKNLEEIYDLDDSSMSSSVKSRATSSGKSSSAGSAGDERLKMKLVTPKIEK
ncbi:hypothetical protein SSX86_032650, partial [Deinandra increscens subsp. villosa]